ncbi:hypothetical protein PENSPDRAFT_657111 [Peniophora sp. CONT]|nr:hypothetical protein PENSPDRAFT_657111 [Peniophora sp. CONT]
MPCQISGNYWSDAFQERLQALPPDVEVLAAELCQVSREYKVFCTGLNARLEGLRHKRHSTRTVSPSTLPAEILLLIFGFLSEDEPIGDLHGCKGKFVDMEGESSDDDDGLQGPVNRYFCHADDGHCCLIPALGWSRVSHVCSYWRSVAIGNAMLWTTIPLNLCTPWIRDILLRSKSLALDITIPCDANWDAVSMVLSQFHRIRSIDAERNAGIISDYITTHSARRLESLRIDHSLGNDPLCLSDDMIHCYPRLKELSIPAAAFLPSLVHGLTHFALLSVEVPPSVNGLYNFIKSLEGIQYLHLENCFSMGHEDIYPQTIVLSHLETLILRGQASSCGALIRSIIYPPSASTTLYMTPDEPQISDTSEYMRRSGLDMLLENIASTVYHSLHVSCVETGPSGWQLVVAGQRDPCQIGDYIRDSTRVETEWTGPSFQDLKIVCMLSEREEHEYAHNLALKLFTQIMSNLPLSSLSNLSLNVDALLSLDGDPWDHARWLSALKVANEVEHLQLISSEWRFSDTNKHAQPSPYVDLLVALSMGPIYSVSHAIMPKLDTMTLVDVDAASTALLEGNGTWRKDLWVSAAQALRFFVRARPSFDESHIHVSNYGTAWRDGYFKSESSIQHATGPLEEMGWEFQKEKDRIEEHSMIKSSVLWLFPPIHTD